MDDMEIRNGSPDGAEQEQTQDLSTSGNMKGDESDAWGSSSSSRGFTGAMPVGKNEMYYNMLHSRRGFALIFNHEFFDNPSLSMRSGTNVDSANLKDTLQNYGFEVSVHKDLRWKEMEYVIEKVANSNHSDADCLLVVVLSHGEEGTLFSRDLPYKPDRLWSPFTADQCPTLAGKPKMFFIQACQGDRLDAGIMLKRAQSDGFGSALSYKIPTHADFLIAYSTIPGFYSWRNTQRGSWFMQAFCDLLRRSGTTLDLMTLLTLVSQRVAIDFESNSSQPHMHGQKQIPCITSMLTRLIKFSPKP